MFGRTCFYILAGYLAGSVLFARIFGRLFHKDVTEGTKDHNPGTANAFMQGGFFCGALTLVGDIGKGFLPVFFYVYLAQDNPGLWLAPVLAAPVVGHIFPIWFRFRGGKGIATSFGSLLGLFPVVTPVLSLAAVFIFFSVILRVSPHLYRTALTYLCTLALLVVGGAAKGVQLGFCIIAVAVWCRLFVSMEQKERPKVRLLWMR